MFGYVVVNKPELKIKEFNIYKGYYCGLCRSLKKRYGLMGQLTLTYDMTFLSMLLTALYEPEIFDEMHRCIAHPTKKRRMISSKYTDYVADMNIILSYYKSMDDWKDDWNVIKLLFAKLIKSGKNDYLEKSQAIASLLNELGTREKNNETGIDVMAGIFGKIMAILFVPQKDRWSDTLSRMGFFLGKYIYIIDAYEDIEKDLKKGNYNPFKDIYKNEDFDNFVERILTMMISECAREFENLPIIEDVDILRNILYSGVWAKFKAIRNKRRQVEEEKND